MKRSIYVIVATLILVSCGSSDPMKKKQEELGKLKTQRSELDVKIAALEKEVHVTDSGKVTPVTVTSLQPTDFTAYVDVQAAITGDENVVATAKAPGTITKIFVHSGQSVTKGQVLAVLDASTVEQQIKAQEAQVTLLKSLYEKQETLWKQNIGTEVQYESSKAQYESAEKQKQAIIAQRDMYKIISPINGNVDVVALKEGDYINPGVLGIRVVSFDKLKAYASLGESYLGKVKQGDNVILSFPDIKDSIKTSLTYVAQTVDPSSRAFVVQVSLSNNHKIHPNMSCIMKIGNYENKTALIVPVSVIQKTSKGDMLYVAKGNKAESVIVTTGRNSNGQVEILSGLNAGDNVIVAGYEELDNGQQITIKK